ncbi:MAG: cysteine desulfurase family protein [Bacteroidetes bacterium]|nr:cysteine desulfurase family protein [Bacteroidota bacterium]
MRVYLDNAATTPLDPEVLKAMIPVLEKGFGNPSSIHSFGRETRALIEQSRKTVAKLINASPSEIFFTSGGTEANNTAISCSIRDLGIKHAITSPIEHHAVLHTLEAQAKAGNIKLSLVEVDEKGRVKLDHLEKLLAENERSFVSLMHANNELGNLLPIKEVGELCAKYNAVFHSDTVQTMGHYPFNLQELNVHFITCAAHKFHGPKGIGFLYINSKIKIHPFIYGGAQERNMRGGTENIYGIIGLARALELCYEHLDEHMKHISELKDHMAAKLKEAIPGVGFNGDTLGNALYTVLNVSFPPTEMAEMILMNLDINGVAASGGSACSSGSDVGSHVLTALKVNPDRPSVRFSFSKNSTIEEVDYAVEKLKEMFAVKV